MRKGFLYTLTVGSFFLFLFNLTITISLSDFFILKALLWCCFVIMFLIIFISYDLKLSKIASFFSKSRASLLLNLGLVIFLVALTQIFVFKTQVEWDFTKQKLNTLTNFSQQIVTAAPTFEFIIIAKSDHRKSMLAMLELYRLSRSDINFTFLDPDHHALQVQSMGVTQVPALVIQKIGDNVSTPYIVYDISEEEITRKIYQMTQSRQHHICYHQDTSALNFESTDEFGGKYFESVLQAEGYQVTGITNLADEDYNCDLWMLLGFSQDLLPQERLHLIEQYDKGIPFFLTLSVPLDHNDPLQSYPQWQKFFEDLALKSHPHLIINKLSQLSGLDASVTVIQNYQDDSFLGGSGEVAGKSRERILLPLARSIFSLNDTRHGRDQIVAQSNPFPASWGEIRFDDLKSGKAKFDEKEDLPGPLPVMLQRVGPHEQPRMIVIGSTFAFSNQYLSHKYNHGLLLSSLQWLLSDEIIAIDRPGIKVEKVFIAPEQARVIAVTSLLIIPSLFLFAAAFFYFRQIRG